VGLGFGRGSRKSAVSAKSVTYMLQSTVIEIRRYITSGGKDVFGEWLAKLKDVRTRAKIVIRIDRVSSGNFGDCKQLRDGLWELRIDWGPGYRVYYTMLGKTCVLILGAGDKRKQSADIERAIGCLKDFKERTKLA
jgi:putative addiction module killer protein